MRGNKIKEFHSLLDQGVSLEEAVEKSGISKATARVQAHRRKKAKTQEEK